VIAQDALNVAVMNSKVRSVLTRTGRVVIRRAVAAARVTEGSDVARSPTVGDAADGPAAHMHGASRNRGPFMIPADFFS